MKDFKDKVMFITGAAHGFGQVIAEGAADRGMKLTIVDIDEPALKKTYQHILDKGAEVLMVTADVTKEASVDDAVEQAMEKFGRIDLLINNAGIALLAEFGNCRLVIGNGSCIST